MEQEWPVPVRKMLDGRARTRSTLTLSSLRVRLTDPVVCVLLTPFVLCAPEPLVNDQPSSPEFGESGARGGHADPRGDLIGGLTDVSRRRALGGGLLAGAMLLWASGCDGGSKTTITNNDLLRNPDRLPPEPADPRPVVISSTPSPAPSARMPMSVSVSSRSRWTRSTTIAALANPMNGVSRLTVHHTAVASSDIRTEADAIRMLNSVRNSHLKRGWADIGYHYIIDPQGRVWEGRPISWQGAHVEDTNEHNLGICVLGNFDRQTPTPQALASLDAFIVDSSRRFRVPLNRIYTHRELRATECPGNSLQRYMVATRGGGGRVRSALA